MGAVNAHRSSEKAFRQKVPQARGDCRHVACEAPEKEATSMGAALY